MNLNIFNWKFWNYIYQAEAEMAYELQAAKTKQRIKEEQMQIAVVERTQEIEVQKWEVQRREKELDATVRRYILILMMMKLQTSFTKYLRILKIGILRRSLPLKDNAIYCNERWLVITL